MTEAKKVVRLAAKVPSQSPAQAGLAAAGCLQPAVTPVASPAPVEAPAPSIVPAASAPHAVVLRPAPPPAPIPAPAAPPVSVGTGTGILAESLAEGTCPKCGKVVELGGAMPLSDTTCPGCGAKFMVPGKLAGFTLLDRIGAGEMGEIYRARDESLDREVAIKVVLADRAEESTLHERLSREARAAARLSHPHVAQVHALGFSNGHPYLVMELVRGEDMDVMLRKNGPVEERMAMRTAAEVTEGLVALHREGLTHGDIKPGNIILDREGSAKLVDFGLSGMSRRDGSRAIVGTPQYIAPEILRGSPDTPQTDIYSLGATLYHLLAGKPPFEGPTPQEVARARLLNPAEPISKHRPLLAPGTQRIVMKMIEADPARRYKDGKSLLADIRDVRKLLDSPVSSVPRKTAQGLSPGMGAGLSPGGAGRATGGAGTPLQGSGMGAGAAPGVGQGAGPGGTPAIPGGGAPVMAAAVMPQKVEPSPSAGGLAESLKSSLKAAAKVDPPPLPAPETSEAPGKREGKRIRMALIAALVLMVVVAGLAALYLTRARIPGPLGLAPETGKPGTGPETTPPASSPARHGAFVGAQPADPPSAVSAATGPGATPARQVRRGFPRRLSPQWVTSGFGQAGGGTTFWHKGTLLLQGEGFDTAQSRDIFRFCYTPVEGDFCLSVKLVTAAKTDAMAKTGLLIGENTGELGQNIFFGKMGDGSVALQMRPTGEADRAVRLSEGPMPSTLYLQISRWGNTFEAATSTDGIHWQPFAECELAVPARVYGGVAVSAGIAGVVAMAEFRDLVLRVTDPASGEGG